MLILAATPIGNLGDASRRLIETLETAAVLAAEDTRTAQRLLAGLGIVNRPRLVALHDHNEKQRAAEIVEWARAQDVVVVTDAGMPTVSDPGYGVVVEAIAREVAMTLIPGPSAVVSALALSGLPTDRFTFEGFVPRKQGEREAALRALATEARTMVFFEAPTRVAATLASLQAAFGGARRAAVCRELTKLHEEVIRGSLDELVTWAHGGVRGECVLVVAGAIPRVVDREDALAEVRRLVADGLRLKDAAREVAAGTGLSSRDLYQAALADRE